MPRAKKTATNAEDKICEAALRLAARPGKNGGWHSLTLDHVAAAAKIPPAQAKKIFHDKNALLPALIRYIDREAARGAGRIDEDGKPRDRLFEALMARFDALQEHRAGILAVSEETRRDPALARQILPAQWQSMQKILKLAHLAREKDPRGALMAAGLLGIYYWSFCCWQKDHSADMSKTMAGLDRALRFAEIPGEILFRAN